MEITVLVGVKLNGEKKSEGFKHTGNQWKKKSTYNVDNIIKSISQLREPKQFPQFSAV